MTVLFEINCVVLFAFSQFEIKQKETAAEKSTDIGVGQFLNERVRKTLTKFKCMNTTTSNNILASEWLEGSKFSLELGEIISSYFEEGKVVSK